MSISIEDLQELEATEEGLGCPILGSCCSGGIPTIFTCFGCTFTW
ncbi:hypothetical protein [Streptomyces sp. NPDC059063]